MVCVKSAVTLEAVEGSAVAFRLAVLLVCIRGHTLGRHLISHLSDKGGKRLTAVSLGEDKRKAFHLFVG